MTFGEAPVRREEPPLDAQQRTQATLILTNITENPAFQMLSQEAQRALTDLFRRDPTLVLNLARAADEAGTNARRFEEFLRSQAALASQQQLQIALASLQQELASAGRSAGVCAGYGGSEQELATAVRGASREEQQTGSEWAIRQQALDSYLEQMRVDRGRRQDVLNDPLIPQFIIHGSIDMLRSILEMRGVPFDSERFTQISRETARELREMAMRAGISSDIFDMATQLVESAFTHQERAQAADSLLEDLSGMNIAQMNVANVLRLLLQLADAESGLGLGADGRGQSRRERGDSTEEEMDSDRVRELRREARRRLEELVQASDSDMTDYEVTSLADQIEEGMHNGSFYLMDHPNSVPEEQRTSQHALVPGMVPRRIEAEIDGLNFHTGDPELSQRLTDLFGQRRADRRGPRVTGDQE